MENCIFCAVFVSFSLVIFKGTFTNYFNKWRAVVGQSTDDIW